MLEGSSFDTIDTFTNKKLKKMFSKPTLSVTVFMFMHVSYNVSTDEKIHKLKVKGSYVNGLSS